MDWEVVAPMFVAVVFIVTSGTVILLRPLSKRLGNLLEVMATERRNPPLASEEVSRLRDTIETLEGRLTLMEERQEFTDQLLRSAEAGLLGPASTEPRPARRPPGRQE